MHQPLKYTPSIANFVAKPTGLNEETHKFVDDRHGMYNMPKKRYKLVLPGNEKELEYTKTRKRLASRKMCVFFSVISFSLSFSFFLFPFVIGFTVGGVGFQCDESKSKKLPCTSNELQCTKTEEPTNKENVWEKLKLEEKWLIEGFDNYQMSKRT